MKLDLTVNDIKQYIYCKRIVFFHHVMPVEVKPTFKMELGQINEDELRSLEKRRKLSRYDLENGEKLFSLKLTLFQVWVVGKIRYVGYYKERLLPS